MIMDTWVGRLLQLISFKSILYVLYLLLLKRVDNSLLDEMNKIFVQQCAVISIQKGDCAYDLHSVPKPCLNSNRRFGIEKSSSFLCGSDTACVSCLPGLSDTKSSGSRLCCER